MKYTSEQYVVGKYIKSFSTIHKSEYDEMATRLLNLGYLVECNIDSCDHYIKYTISWYDRMRCLEN